MRRFLSRAVVVSSLAFAGAAAGFVALPAPPAAADAVDDAIAALHQMIKQANEGDDGKILAMIIQLEGSPDSRITAAFAEIARTARSERVAVAAMRQAAGRKSPDLLKWLKTKVEDDKLLEKSRERYVAVLDSLARYGDKSTMKPLEDVAKKYMPMDGDLAARAITAYGSIREKVVIENLLKWLQQTENTQAGQGGKNMSSQTREAYQAAGAAILKALQGLTLQDIGDHKTWMEWWEKNKKTFTFPDPNQAEVDPATLAEFTDQAYGWTIKKPEGKFWTFVKPDYAGGRITLTYKDETGLEWARLRVTTWKASTEAPNSGVQAQSWRETWEKDEFSQFSKPCEIQTRKIGGRDFTILTARGVASGSWKAWEGCERRYYGFMPHSTQLLWFDLVVRSGAEDAVKQGLWGAMEGITFKK